MNSNILEDVIRVYKNTRNGALPTELIIYRAGTSEGSFETVCFEGLPEISLAMKNLIKEYREANIKFGIKR